MKSGCLNLLEPSGPHWACYGTTLPLRFSSINGYCNGSKYVYLVESGIFTFCGNAGVQYRRKKQKNQTTNTSRSFKERGLGRGFSRELIRWNGHILRMHKDGVTEEENSQKEDRDQGGNRRFGKCHIEWRNNIGG